MTVTSTLSGEIPDVKRDQQRIVDFEQKQAWLSVLLIERWRLLVVEDQDSET
jgi:hypothetical protein